MASGIYRIRNRTTGKCYVGSAVNIERRWGEHRAYLRGGYHHSQHMQRAWLLHGEEEFLFEVIEEVCPERLIEREQHWIDALAAYGRSGYNVSPTAGSSLGLTRSAETRKRVSEAKMGSTPWNKGKQTGAQSPEHIESRFVSRRGVSRPDEVKARISATKKANGSKPTLEVLAASARVRAERSALRQAGLLPPQYDEARKQQVGDAIRAGKLAAKLARLAHSQPISKGV